MFLIAVCGVPVAKWAIEDSGDKRPRSINCGKCSRLIGSSSELLSSSPIRPRTSPGGKKRRRKPFFVPKLTKEKHHCLNAEGNYLLRTSLLHHLRIEPVQK